MTDTQNQQEQAQRQANETLGKILDGTNTAFDYGQTELNLEIQKGNYGSANFGSDTSVKISIPQEGTIEVDMEDFPVIHISRNEEEELIFETPNNDLENNRSYQESVHHILTAALSTDQNNIHAANLAIIKALNEQIAFQIPEVLGEEVSDDLAKNINGDGKALNGTYKTPAGNTTITHIQKDQRLTIESNGKISSIRLNDLSEILVGDRKKNDNKTAEERARLVTTLENITQIAEYENQSFLLKELANHIRTSYEEPETFTKIAGEAPDAKQEVQVESNEIIVRLGNEPNSLTISTSEEETELLMQINNVDVTFRINEDSGLLEINQENYSDLQSAIRANPDTTKVQKDSKEQEVHVLYNNYLSENNRDPSLEAMRDFIVSYSIEDSYSDSEINEYFYRNILIDINNGQPPYIVFVATEESQVEINTTSAEITPTDDEIEMDEAQEQTPIQAIIEQLRNSETTIGSGAHEMRLTSASETDGFLSITIGEISHALIILDNGDVMMTIEGLNAIHDALQALTPAEGGINPLEAINADNTEERNATNEYRQHIANNDTEDSISERIRYFSELTNENTTDQQREAYNRIIFRGIALSIESSEHEGISTVESAVGLTTALEAQAEPTPEDTDPITPEELTEAETTLASVTEIQGETENKLTKETEQPPKWKRFMKGVGEALAGMGAGMAIKAGIAALMAPVGLPFAGAVLAGIAGGVLVSGLVLPIIRRKVFHKDKPEGVWTESYGAKDKKLSWFDRKIRNKVIETYELPDRLKTLTEAREQLMALNLTDADSFSIIAPEGASEEEIATAEANKETVLDIYKQLAELKRLTDGKGLNTIDLEEEVVFTDLAGEQVTAEEAIEELSNIVHAINIRSEYNTDDIDTAVITDTDILIDQAHGEEMKAKAIKGLLLGGLGGAIGHWLTGIGEAAETDTSIISQMDTDAHADQMKVLSHYGVDETQFKQFDIDGNGVINGQEEIVKLNGWLSNNITVSTPSVMVAQGVPLSGAIEHANIPSDSFKLPAVWGQQGFGGNWSGGWVMDPEVGGQWAQWQSDSVNLAANALSEDAFNGEMGAKVTHELLREAANGKEITASMAADAVKQFGGTLQDAVSGTPGIPVDVDAPIRLASSLGRISSIVSHIGTAHATDISQIVQSTGDVASNTAVGNFLAEGWSSLVVPAVGIGMASVYGPYGEKEGERSNRGEGITIEDISNDKGIPNNRLTSDEILLQPGQEWGGQTGVLPTWAANHRTLYKISIALEKAKIWTAESFKGIVGANHNPFKGFVIKAYQDSIKTNDTYYVMEADDEGTNRVMPKTIGITMGQWSISEARTNSLEFLNDTRKKVKADLNMIIAERGQVLKDDTQPDESNSFQKYIDEMIEFGVEDNDRETTSEMADAYINLLVVLNDNDNLTAEVEGEQRTLNDKGIKEFRGAVQAMFLRDKNYATSALSRGSTQDNLPEFLEYQGMSVPIADALVRDALERSGFEVPAADAEGNDPIYGTNIRQIVLSSGLIKEGSAFGNMLRIIHEDSTATEETPEVPPITEDVPPPTETIDETTTSDLPVERREGFWDIVMDTSNASTIEHDDRVHLYNALAYPRTTENVDPTRIDNLLRESNLSTAQLGNLARLRGLPADLERDEIINRLAYLSDSDIVIPGMPMQAERQSIASSFINQERTNQIMPMNDVTLLSEINELLVTRKVNQTETEFKQRLSQENISFLRRLSKTVNTTLGIQADDLEIYNDTPEDKRKLIDKITFGSDF